MSGHTAVQFYRFLDGFRDTVHYSSVTYGHTDLYYRYDMKNLYVSSGTAIIDHMTGCRSAGNETYWL